MKSLVTFLALCLALTLPVNVFATGNPYAAVAPQVTENSPLYDSTTCAQSTTPSAPQPSGGVKFTTQMTIDDDGVGPSHGDPNHQGQTSYANGQLNADATSYIALAPGWAAANGLQLGDIAVVQHSGRTAYAVYGDNYTGDQVHGEGSVHLSMTLGGDASNTIPAPVDYTVYPNSHTQLDGSVDQSKIDQLGASLSGGAAPAATPASGTCCTTSPVAAGTPTTLTGSDNPHKAYNFMVQAGLTPAQAVGLMANLLNESSTVDPSADELKGTASSPTDGDGFGIVQWTYTARQAPLVAFAASQDKPVTDLLVQLQFMWHELNTDYKSTLDAVKQVSGSDAGAASQAALLFRDGYEGCDKSYASCSGRGSFAASIFSQYANSAPGSPAGSSGGGCSSSGATAASGSCSGSGQYSALVGPGASFAGGDEGIDFIPSDPKGFDICAPGPGTITLADQTGHTFARTSGTAEVIEKLDQNPSAPSSSQYIYFAEIIQINSSIKVGTHVSKGDIIGHNDQSPGIEVGWALNAGHGFKCTISGGTTPCGQSFESWVQGISGGQTH